MKFEKFTFSPDNIAKSITLAGVSLYYGGASMNVLPANANKIDSKPIKPSIERLNIDSNGNISLSKTATEMKLTTVIDGGDTQINSLYKIGILKLVIDPTTGQRKVEINKTKMRNIFPESSNTSKPIPRANEIQTPASNPNNSEQTKSPTKNEVVKKDNGFDGLKTTALASLASLGIVGWINRKKFFNRSKSITKEVENPELYRPTEIGYDIKKSMHEMRRFHDESAGDSIRSIIFDTNPNPNLVPIYFDINKQPTQFGFFYNRPDSENTDLSEYTPGLRGGNFGMTNYTRAMNVKGTQITELYQAKCKSISDSLRKQKHELVVINDVVVNKELLKMGEFYVMYFTPVFTNEVVVGHNCTMIPRLEGVEIPNFIDVVGDFGTLELQEKFKGNQENVITSFHTLIVNLRNELSVANGYGNCFSNFEKRMNTQSAMLDALGTVGLKTIIGLSDVNYYGANTVNGNDPITLLKNSAAEFYSILKGNKNWHKNTAELKFSTSRHNNHGISLLVPKNKDGSNKTTFLGVDKIDNPRGLKNQLQGSVVQKILNYTLDTGITNQPDKHSLVTTEETEDHLQNVLKRNDGKYHLTVTKN